MTLKLSDHVEIKLKNVLVEAHCGIHPWEMHPERPNRLSVNVTLYANLPQRRLADFGFIDYDHIRDFLKHLPTRPHTDLIETLLDEIVDRCFSDTRVDACYVSIMKLDIFSEAEAAGVEVYRTRSQWA